MPIKMVTVEGWPMETYPMLSKEGNPFSAFFKFEYLKYDGNTDFKTWHYKGPDENGVEVEVDVPYQVRAGVVSMVPKPKPPRVSEDDPEWYGMISRIRPHDIIATEKDCGGKPTMVKVGLYGEWVNGEWVMDDLDKIRIPRFYLDITEKYYKWREEAYQGSNDPFKNQVRPYTKIQEMEAKIKELEKTKAAT